MDFIIMLKNKIQNIFYYSVYNISYYFDTYMSSNSNTIEFSNNNQLYISPQREDDTFIDLYSNINIIIPPKGNITIPIGLQCKVPNNIIGEIIPVKELYTNSINLKSEYLKPGIINNIKIYLFNNSDIPYHIYFKQKIAKILCIKYIKPNIKIIVNKY
ncbi:unknown similar to AMEV107 [Mythimna separata entomopoxvirus 'L']|uniref:dUTPase-like domain-containing protein n=1 Tax=Mythimna separata entomopoxvirus 'L' TaxID=1293572 RepID=A0A916KQ41_9POXV|nr:unknown similar to AMEV107 [Mythimna separata entomopoxvirus 'L']CCU56324.1 unknown similar to AMEV107 [Mythimna separata entomopoxvirus 'L']